MEQLHEPTWAIAELFPPQGTWSEEEYLHLNTSRLVEFDNGFIEVLPMPSEHHQEIIFYLWSLIRQYLHKTKMGGKILAAPFPVYLKNKKYREPDLLYMLEENSHRRHTNHWDGADLVIEVISPDDPNRDLITKRKEYAEAGIPEYWLVHPFDETVTVLTLDGAKYAEYGVFGMTSIANSKLLPNFTLDISDLFQQTK